jgi:putative flippase GtrA
MILRFVRFNLVGALGILLQLAAVALLVGVLGVHYIVATALAIEMAVLHNFAWHERWTWRDRHASRSAPTPANDGGRRTEKGLLAFRCLAFHAGNGCVSLLGSLALLPLLVGVLHLHYLVANIGTIGATGLLNFLISDRVVFRPPTAEFLSGTATESGRRRGADRTPRGSG